MRKRCYNMFKKRKIRRKMQKMKGILLPMVYLLSDDQKEKIEKLATKVRSDYCLGLSIDVIAFAKDKLGFEVSSMQMESSEITGMILVDPINGQREIGINQDLGYEKGRFITSHEIGHYFIETIENNHTGGVFAFRDNRNREGTESEASAEYFAYCFLMPETYMRSAIKIYNKDDSLKNRFSRTLFVSNLFGVTEDKAEKRLMQLSLIGR